LYPKLRVLGNVRYINHMQQGLLHVTLFHRALRPLHKEYRVLCILSFFAIMLLDCQLLNGVLSVFASLMLLLSGGRVKKARTRTMMLAKLWTNGAGELSSRLHSLNSTFRPPITPLHVLNNYTTPIRSVVTNRRCHVRSLDASSIRHLPNA
jgi:hypothetical protein